MSRKRRKVVLVIVEGPSDETALEQSFAALFDPDDVMIKVVHGDMTADIGVNPSNIVSSVGNLVKDWASKYGLKRPDFLVKGLVAISPTSLPCDGCLSRRHPSGPDTPQTSLLRVTAVTREYLATDANTDFSKDAILLTCLRFCMPS